MPQVMYGWGPNARYVVVSLCDYSGNWARPWHEIGGYTVLHYDLKHGDDVLTLEPADVLRDCAHAVPDCILGFDIACVLSAPPCTDFSVSGAQYWAAKDADGRTAQALAVLDACVRLSEALAPDCWALENPVGRIPRLRPALGKPALYFDPCDFAGWADDPATDAYTKKTGLWGCFAGESLWGRLRYVEPVRVCSQGSWVQKLGGKSERTKTLRSMTPAGFARAFYHAHR